MSMIDVVGIGAINEDYYLKNSSANRILLNTLPIENRRESFVSDKKIEDVIIDQGKSAFEIVLGGSALNTIRTIAGLGVDLNTGFIGVVGNRDRRLGIQELLSGIDLSLVRDVNNSPPSRCLVFSGGNDTKLLTAPGATAEFCTAITEQDIVAYLSKCRWVHVSSFADVAILDYVVTAIKAAKTHNTGLTVSFDPGHQYTEQHYSEVMEALSISDFLFVNFIEFCQLAQRDSVRPKIAEIIRSGTALFQNTPFSGQAIILKSATSNFWLQKTNTSVLLRRYWHQWLPSFLIKDDVGAGDIFSAGVIAGMLAPRFVGFGKGPTRLASALVRSKLRARNGRGLPIKQFQPIAERQSLFAHNVTTSHLIDLLAVYVPPAVRYILAILASIIATLILK